MAYERGDERCLGVAVDLLRGSDLLDSSLVHHPNSIGEGECLLLIVGYVDCGETDLLLNATNFASQGFTQLGVKCGERLIEEQDLRFGGKGACQGDSLALSGGEFGRSSTLESP
jgi:hypothetical protein